MCIYAYIYAHTHTYICIHTYIYMNECIHKYMLLSILKSRQPVVRAKRRSRSETCRPRSVPAAAAPALNSRRPVSSIRHASHAPSRGLP